MDGIIIIDDARYNYAKEYLQEKKYVFHEQSEQPDNFDFIIFSFKESIDESFFDPKYFKAVNKKAKIFSGVRDKYITEQCKKNGLEYHVIMEDSGVAAKNAVPTSEGVIAYLIMNRTKTISGCSHLVIGYGVCGRDLAKKLKALGAEVFALVRNKEKESLASGDAVKPVYISEIRNKTFDIIINTVPNLVITNETLDRLSGALMIDIASKPYGFDMDYAKKLNEKSALLSGIPGKYAVCGAGEIIGEFIDSRFKADRV